MVFTRNIALACILHLFPSLKSMHNGTYIVVGSNFAEYICTIYVARTFNRKPIYIRTQWKRGMFLLVVCCQQQPICICTEYNNNNNKTHICSHTALQLLPLHIFFIWKFGFICKLFMCYIDQKRSRVLHIGNKNKSQRVFLRVLVPWIWKYRNRDNVLYVFSVCLLVYIIYIYIIRCDQLTRPQVTSNAILITPFAYFLLANRVYNRTTYLRGQNEEM